MGKRNQVNPYAKREEELANALLNAGKPKEEAIEIQEVKEATPEIQEVTKEIAVEQNTQKVEEESVEVIKQEPVKKIIEDKPVEQPDLFTLKKKVKITKRQKNLNLKEDNIDALVNFAKKNDFNEGEVIDYLIENYLKLIKIK